MAPPEASRLPTSPIANAAGLIRRFVAIAIGALTLLLTDDALAGYSVSPNGQIISVTTDAIGYISTPSTIDFTVYLDELDREPYIWISESPQMTTFGTPMGSSVGGCAPYDLVSAGQGRWVCRESTILMRPGRTYYWWMDFRRLDTADFFGQQRVSGPFTFTLLAQTLPPPPPPTEDEEGAELLTSGRTVESAANLPSRSAYRGSSIKHERLSTLVYKTMKRLGYPKTLAVACWSDDDWLSVLESEGDTGVTSHTVLQGFWLPRQPRWLHVAPHVCTRVQHLLDGTAANGKAAASLTTVIHETLHAHGLRVEAQVNCYAVQLVYAAGMELGRGAVRSMSLSKQAVRYVRLTAPSGYWNHLKCRDGGSWDLLRSEPNLS